MKYGRNHDSELYRDWADNWQTSIILNGGTTNLNPDRLGTLNKHYQTLVSNGVVCEAFYEPDLGDQMTAFVFIVDERDFKDSIDYNSSMKEWLKQFSLWR